MLELFLSAFVTFAVVIDAPGVAPIFAGLTDGAPRTYQRQMAFRAITVAAIVLLLFAFVGKFLFDKMGVSMPALQIAGGVLLFLIAVDMVFEKRTERRETRAEKVLEHEREVGHFEDISVFPIAIPMVAGPGCIAAVMLQVGDQSGWLEKGVVLLALGLNLLICLGMFLVAGPVVRAMGPTIAGTVTRVLGVILAALASQFILNGVRTAFGVIAT